MLKRRVLLVAVLGSVFSLCSLLYGQANGVLSGTVSDKTGSVIAGATVRITSQGTGLTREVKTDGSGHYLIPLIPVAVYTIHVEFQGFQTTEQRDVRLQVEEQREIDFSLNPASVSSTVEVSAGPTSTLVGCSILNWLMLAVAEWLKENGHPPPVLRSQTRPGAVEHNRALGSRYKGRLSRQLA